MSNIKDREKFDNYEMKNEYDFRNRIYYAKPLKTMKLKMRKAFTMIEVIIVMAILAMLSYYAVVQSENARYNIAVADFYKQFDNIVRNGIIDPTTGYTNATGSPCSDDYNFLGISAARVNACTKMNFGIAGADTTYTAAGDQNYFANIFPDYTDGNGKIYVYNNGTWNEFKIFIDLSAVESSRKRLYVEEYIENSIIKKYSSVATIQVFKYATSVTTDAGGTIDDGKIGFKFIK